MNKEITAYLKRIGSKGGKSTSKRKSASSRRNAATATKARLAKLAKK